MKYLSILCLAILFTVSPAKARELTLQGHFTQGGLVIGHTSPDSRVSLDGKDIVMSPEGTFILGFGRNAAPSAQLQVTHADGRQENRTIRVKSRTYKEQRINGLPKKKVTPPPEDLRRIREDNGLIKGVRDTTTLTPFFLSGFSWPVKGPLSGVFGSLRILNGKPRSPHNGVDVAAPTGTVITAPADGNVVLVHDDMFYTGKTVMLDHGLGLSSVYAHMSAISVKEGDAVNKGQPIGKIGKTGRATGPHLHWGVTLERTHLDPALLAGDMP